MEGQLTLDFVKSESGKVKPKEQIGTFDNEFLLQDRIQKIQQIVGEYGEDKFYIGFSGGKDSTVLSVLIDLALPNNCIPRVFADTGIELNAIRDFVLEKKSSDDRFYIIKPSVPIKKMLEEYGYPFKSKAHSKILDLYQRKGMNQAIENYLETDNKNKDYYRVCPDILKYQFSPDFKIRVSDKCCLYMKEKPLMKWSKENKRPYAINGLMKSEGGRRNIAVCMSFKRNKLRFFQPLVPLDEAWEKWFIDKYDIKLCKLYYPPYNLTRTGCKACPFGLHIQDELDMLQEFFPEERKQCELIWKPVLDEYRRIGYRLRQDGCKGQLSLFEDEL